MESRKLRIDSIDLLRGLVMIVMALDHTRDFLHSAAGQFQPDDLTRTTAALFLTRWITHFCAPVFMLTAGLGAFFYGRRGRPALAKFLLTRGLWLMLLEVTVLRFAFFFSLTQGPVLLTILWVLGLSMVLLAGLVYLPRPLLAGVSIAMILFHNLFDAVNPARFGAAAWLWTLLHRQGVITVSGVVFVVAYPLIPWVGVMAAGYCLGPVFLFDGDRRRRILVPLGLSLSLAFLVLRAINVYGDPSPWRHMDGVKTVLSFLRTTKYPPSLDFLLMTLGPALALLGFFGDRRVRRTSPMLVFGRVPLFYFLLHMFAIHFAAMVLAFFRYGSAWIAIPAPPAMGTPPARFPPDYGYSLWVVYAVWLAVVALLYPLCLWFSRVKERRRDWWLGYL
jgi:uncharacterized membrane protein